jgi:hypothetical protein
VSRGTFIVLIWAAWLTALAALLFAWTPGDWVQWLPFASAAAAAWAVGLVLLVRRGRPAVTRVILDFSPGAAVVAIGVAALAQGASLGVWLVYAGAGLVAVGLGTTLRETLAARRTRRDA